MQPSEAEPDGSRRVAVVSVVEGPDLQAETAFLAGALRRIDVAPHRVAIDFCTTEDAFQATLEQLAPTAVLLPYATEFRSILVHLAAEARQHVSGPVAIIGDGVARETLPPPAIDGVNWIAGDPGLGLEAVLAGRPSSADADYASIAPVIDLFDSVPSLRPMSVSLFGEPGTVALMGSRPARDTIAPTALLARCEAPADAACRLESDVALEPLASCGDGVRAVEWWDRDPGIELGDAVREVAARGLRQSVRVRPEPRQLDLLGTLKEMGVGRVVFEVDRLSGADFFPGTCSTAEELKPWADEAHRLDLEVGILLVVGIPFETRDLARRRTEAVRALRPHRLRAIPYEPTGGSLAWSWSDDLGMLPNPDRGWQRELHRPLRQDSLPAEDFVADWAEALDLLAEVEAAASSSEPAS
ncbi:MAG: hypothetical protein CMJ18_16820 [Phycisphaeraceae bacterium]|nr:hypothetical protein [Phycisphaeraceae bacterium]